MNKKINYIEINRDIHDAQADEYDSHHLEIYNPTEQHRIQCLLKKTVHQIKKTVNSPIFLDYGCGTGNISMKLLKLGVEVVAADISSKSLEKLKHKSNNNPNLKIVHLKSSTNEVISTEFFDCVIIYSVLHHIPDYIDELKNIAQNIKAGGLLIIDHEASPHYWPPSTIYLEYKKKINQKLGFKKKWFSFINNLFDFRFLIWKIRTSIFQQSPPGREGDIHVHKYDHIEWDKIEKIFENSFSMEETVDYLICRETDDNPTLWENYNDKCVDMRYTIFRKR